MRQEIKCDKCEGTGEVRPFLIILHHWWMFHKCYEKIKVYYATKEQAENKAAALAVARNHTFNHCTWFVVDPYEEFSMQKDVVVINNVDFKTLSRKIGRLYVKK